MSKPSNFTGAMIYFSTALAFSLAIGAARFGYSELYGLAGIFGCLAGFTAIVNRALL